MMSETRSLFSEVMKNMSRGILSLLVACATSISYGGQAPAPRGVHGVDVIVKQNPSKRTMTDTRGNFALDGLAPGTYALTFRPRKAKDTKNQASDEVTVATSYSIKVDGGKRVVNQSGLTTDNLLGASISLSKWVRGQRFAGRSPLVRSRKWCGFRRNPAAIFLGAGSPPTHRRPSALSNQTPTVPVGTVCGNGWRERRTSLDREVPHQSVELDFRSVGRQSRRNVAGFRKRPSGFVLDVERYGRYSLKS
jgi:hypothetical protein